MHEKTEAAQTMFQKGFAYPQGTQAKRSMAVQIFYVKVENKVETDKEDVLFKDVAKVLCRDSKKQKKVESMLVYRFVPSTHRVVIDTLTLIKMIEDVFPECEVVSLGESDVVIERTPPDKPVLEWIKVTIVGLICFFGAAFTIMAYHNDISINHIFAQVYELLTGKESDGFTVLEVMYSIGLAGGIILFFNHIGTRRITKDPTPIEVQMRQYESNVVTALVENANRNKEEL